MTIRNIWLPMTAVCVCAVAMLAHDAEANAQAPKPIKNGEVLSGELRVMRSRAKGKRINTYQVISTEGRRIPGPDGLCNLETGPETFQIVTNGDARREPAEAVHRQDHLDQGQRDVVRDRGGAGERCAGLEVDDRPVGAALRRQARP